MTVYRWAQYNWYPEYIHTYWSHAYIASDQIGQSLERKISLATKKIVNSVEKSWAKIMNQVKNEAWTLTLYILRPKISVIDHGGSIKLGLRWQSFGIQWHHCFDINCKATFIRIKILWKPTWQHVVEWSGGCLYPQLTRDQPWFIEKNPTKSLG